MMILSRRKNGITAAAVAAAASAQAKLPDFLKAGVPLGLLLAALAFMAAPTSATWTGSPVRTPPSAFRQWVDKNCNELVKTKKISFVQELISNLELLGPVEGPSEQTHGIWFFRSRANSSGLSCIENSKAILELKPILKEHHNVCSKQHLDLIEDYYKRHIRSGPNNLINSMVGTKTITENFFMLYARQVSHKCKKSMLKSLSQMKTSGVVTEADFEKALPWIRDSSVMDTCAMNNPFAPSQQAERKPKHNCRELSVISGIKDINELALLIKSPDVLLTMNKFGEAGGTESEKLTDESSQAGDDRNGLIIVVPPNRMQMISELTMACLKFKPIYENIILPVVRLAHMGASTEFKRLDRACKEEPFMRKWFAITLVCETMLKSRLAKSNEKYEKFIGSGPGKDDVSVVYDECDDEQADCSALEEQFASETKPDLESLRRITNTLDDELWIYKYKTTALQRLKENMKLFSIDDVQSHIVFVQKTAHVRRWIGRGIVTALLIAAINKV